MQAVLSHDWPAARAVPCALESVALSLSRARTPDSGALERCVRTCGEDHRSISAAVDRDAHAYHSYVATYVHVS